MRLRNKLFLGFAVPVAFIIVLSTMISLSLDRLRTASGWVEHTHIAIGYGKKLVYAMIDKEIGLRGLLITNDAAFLEPY